MTTSEPTSWTVGELARSAGVTPRTLRHYDQHGLLPVSGHSEGGHRRYGPDDVARLYRILTLRSLGLRLDELAPLLDGDDQDLLATAKAQRERVEELLDHHTQLRSRLDDVIASVEHRRASPTADLLATLETMKMTVNLTRIYTRLGDAGQTDLADRTRVDKTDTRVEAVGAIDELNASLGIVLTFDVESRLVPWLRQIQNDLFDLGADLSRTEATESPSIVQDNIVWLEQLCDLLNEELEPLRSFVLPGGGTATSAHLHAARTICRRAERRVLATDDAGHEAVAYLNRLSDLLFILSRATSQGDEALWEPRRRPDVECA